MMDPHSHLYLAFVELLHNSGKSGSQRGALLYQPRTRQVDVGAELALILKGLPAGGVQALRPLSHKRLVDLEVCLEPGLEGEPLVAVVIGT